MCSLHREDRPALDLQPQDALYAQILVKDATLKRRVNCWWILMVIAFGCILDDYNDNSF